MLLYKSIFHIITKRSDVPKRCHTVSNDVFFRTTKSYLGGNHMLLRGLTWGVIIKAEIVGISV